jgi:hypothetical protein
MEEELRTLDLSHTLGTAPIQGSAYVLIV